MPNLWKKLMFGNNKNKALVESRKGKTMVLEANLNKSTVNIPRMLSWDEVTKNPNWVIKNAFTPKETKKELSHIIELK